MEKVNNFFCVCFFLYEINIITWENNKKHCYVLYVKLLNINDYFYIKNIGNRALDASKAQHSFMIFSDCTMDKIVV